MLGLGAEYAFMNNWSVKAEYNLLDFSDPKAVDERGTLTSFAGVTSPIGTRVNVVERIHLAKIGLNYHFGQRRAEIAPSIPRTGYNWSGFYVGGQIGWQWLEGDFKDPAYEPHIGTDYDDDDIVYGGHAGFNFQYDAFVFGFEADLEGTDLDAEGTDTSVFGDTVTGRAKIDLEASLRARLGWAFDNILFYATGGIAIADGDFSYTYENNGITDRFSDTLSGWTIGGGVEYGLSENLSTRLEYRYTDYDEVSGDITKCCAPPPNAQDHDLESHTVRLGVSYRFSF
jgi:outer membrane immunogenic protein